MSVTNYVDAKLSADDVSAINAAIGVLHEKLPFLINLLPDERRALPKMGDKSRAFVDKTLLAAQANKVLLPVGFDLAGFERDYALWLALAPVAQQLGQFQELFDDTMTALSSDLYTEALAVYSYLKAGGADAGLNEVRAAIGKRFARRPVAATTAPATASHA